MHVADRCVGCSIVRLSRWVMRIRSAEKNDSFDRIGISSSLTALTDHPHDLLIAGAISEMVGLSICHALASIIERRRLLIFFFIATAMVSILVPVTHNTEPYGNYPLDHRVFCSYVCFDFQLVAR